MSTNYSGYAAAKVVNERLTSEGLKNIPPQMIYNYVSKGYIPARKINGKKVIASEDLAAWLETYIARKKLSYSK